MAAISQIRSSELLEATQFAETLKEVPEAELPRQVDLLERTLSILVERIVRQPVLPATGASRYFTASQMPNHKEVTRILQLAKKHLTDREATSTLSSLEPVERCLNSAIKTCAIQLPGGSVIEDVPFSKDSLIDVMSQELGDEGMPLIGESSSDSLLESILVSYKNHMLQLDDVIPGDPSLARVLSLNLSLDDLIKDQTILAQSTGKQASDGRKTAIAMFLAMIRQIDYLNDDAIAEVPSIKKLLYDYSKLPDENLVCLYLMIKDSSIKLMHRVNIVVHVEMIKRRKANAALDAKLKTLDGALPEGEKFYANSFGVLKSGQESSISRYCAELLSAPQKEYERLLQSKLSAQLPAFVLEPLFDRCIKASTTRGFIAILKASKNVKDSIYLKFLESGTSPILVTRLLTLACYHGKVAVVREVLSKHPSLESVTLLNAFKYACMGGHIPVLELFRSRFPSFLRGGEGIGLALNTSAELNMEAVADFLMGTELFKTCPASGDNSVAHAAYAAIEHGNYSFFEKLRNTVQFSQIPLEGDSRDVSILAILNALANRSQLPLVLSVMNMDHFKRSLPEEITVLLGEHCGTTKGAFLFGCGQGWESLVLHIIASAEFEEIPAHGNFGVGRALVLASEQGHTSIVRAILASSKLAQMPADGDHSIAKAFCSAADNGHSEIVDTFLKSSRSDEISLEGEFSLARAARSALKKGHLPVFLQIRSHPRIQEKMPEQKALLAETHGPIKQALAAAVNQKSLPLIQAILASHEFKHIPLVGPYSLMSAIDAAIAAGNFSIAGAILSSNRTAEIPSEKILSIWNQGLARAEAHSLAAGILQGTGSSHIPMDGERGLQATYRRAKAEGHLSLYLACQSHFRIQLEYLVEEECSLLKEENGGIRRALMSACENGYLALAKAIFKEAEVFDRIPASGDYSLQDAFEWALQFGHMEVVQAFLDSSRREEIPLGRREYAVAVLAHRALGPTNSIARFFWSIGTPPPIDPAPYVQRGFKPDYVDRSYSPASIDYD